MNSYSGRRVLVTGGSGFIGSHLIRTLQNLGAEVYATQYKNATEGISVSCDLRDAQQVERVVVSTCPEFVFHLAAQALVEKSQKYVRESIETNVMGTFNLLDSVARLLFCPYAVVVASTDKVMGRQSQLPYTEQSPLLGTQQVYEASKVCEDVLTQMAGHSMQLPVGITRFGNVYGPGDGNFSRLIPGTIQAYLHGEQPTIRSDGQHYRDYVYIEDVVDGYLRLGEFLVQHPAPQIINFGTGKPSRTLDIVAMIHEHFPQGKPPKVLYGAKDEIERQYVNGEKAHKLLGWVPKINLQGGISKTVEWYRGVYAQSN